MKRSHDFTKQSSVVSLIKGVCASIVLALNVVVFCTLLIPFVLLKIVAPVTSIRLFADKGLNGIANAWVRVNDLWINAVCRNQWNVVFSGEEELSTKGWFLIGCNHQSWVDILVLQRVLAGKVPLLKFFLKKELIYIPIIGLAWWALDFPFMRRSGGIKGLKEDMAATEKACHRFLNVPTSVLNFMEGTRFTPEKAAAQKSPYRNLLKPKSVGIGMAISSMGQALHEFVDVTIVYHGKIPTFIDLLCGNMDDISIDVKVREIHAAMRGYDFAKSSTYRGRVQSWVESIWLEKDAQITEMKNAYQGKSKAVLAGLHPTLSEQQS